MKKYQHHTNSGVHQLVPAMKRLTKTKFSLEGAEIFDEKMNYLGWWPAYNMPLALKRELLAHGLHYLEGLSEQEKRWYFTTQDPERDPG